ncbi:MAG: hypothetical protein PHN37_01885, partial [Candidatus Pacebacteria bacterium]|nr:hypothetical protein [Candidatus Paceibacterota bacterium]
WPQENYSKARIRVLNAIFEYFKHQKKVENIFNQGLFSFKKRRYFEAVESFKQVLKLDPWNKLAEEQLSLCKRTIEERQKRSLLRKIIDWLFKK